MRKLIVATAAAAALSSAQVYATDAQMQSNPVAANNTANSQVDCSASNPCASAHDTPCSAIDCSPCATIGCNPCAAMPCNPCNPCAVTNPCATGGPENACNPCNPCASNAD